MHGYEKEYKKMATSEQSDESLYPIAVLIDELRNEDVQVYVFPSLCQFFKYLKQTTLCN